MNEKMPTPYKASSCWGMIISGIACMGTGLTGIIISMISSCFNGHDDNNIGTICLVLAIVFALVLCAGIALYFVGQSKRKKDSEIERRRAAKISQKKKEICDKIIDVMNRAEEFKKESSKEETK